ncbi:glycosyltransferase family 2 protein [Candidatus Omnitrophota bacterium]
MTPQITVLMAVYNCEKYLRECMDSVLNQTHKDFEFLIVDDGSTDKTVDIIKSYQDNRIRLIRNDKNMSQVSSLNIGLEHARSDYIARIDGDDIMFPDRLERQFDFLKKSKAVLVGSRARAIDENGKTIKDVRLPIMTEEIIGTVLCGGFITVHSTLMFRKRPVLDIGKYNEDFSFVEDYKLVTDLLINQHKISNMDEVLVKFRFHEDRISVRDKRPQNERYLNALKAFMNNFTKEFSGKDKDMLFEFLIDAGSMNKKYWENGCKDEDLKKIVVSIKLLIKNISEYFKLSRKGENFLKRVFYNNILNFTYQSAEAGKVARGLYLLCLKNLSSLYARPKLYLYPVRLLLACLFGLVRSEKSIVFSSGHGSSAEGG